MKHYAADVNLFNKTGGIELTSVYTPMVKMQCDLIQEEYTELSEAIKSGDKIKILDGVIDLAYVLIGLGLMEIGQYSTDKEYRETLLKRNIKDIDLFISSKIPPVKYCSAFNWVSTFVDSILVMNEQNCYTPLNPGKFMCAKAVIYLKKLAEEMGFNFDGAWDEVQASNMSKFCTKDDGSLYAIHRDDGKILKGPNYFRPDLAKFIYPEKL